MQVDELWQELSVEIVTLIATFRSRLSALSVSSKPDRTLLTDADTAVQDLIIEKIRNLDSHSPIIAEEDYCGTHRRPGGSKYSWIVDPIDGTSQFVEPFAIEFCSVIALYENGHPLAVLVIAPEFGVGRTPVIVSTASREGRIAVNGTYIQAGPREPLGYASTTRSQGSAPSQVERLLVSRQYEVKTRTTSQTLDLVRTALDLTTFAPHAMPFDLFHRRRQKLWDGAAGFGLARAAGLTISDEDGRPLLPLPFELLAQAEPVLPSSMIGQTSLINNLIADARCQTKPE